MYFQFNIKNTLNIQTFCLFDTEITQVAHFQFCFHFYYNVILTTQILDHFQTLMHIQKLICICAYFV